jgi:multiple sugar transport system permease protein
MTTGVKRLILSSLRYLLVVAATLLLLFPVYIMVSTSLKFEVDAFSSPPKWLFRPTLENYVAVLGKAGFFRFFVNSVIVSLSSTAATVLVAALAAYPLARNRFSGKRAVVGATLFLRMIPPVILVVPVYVFFNSIRLTNGRLALFVIYTALNLPFNIWILRTFIMDLPYELDESAFIDGCSPFAVFAKIVLPLLAPAIAIASVFSFRLAWNEFILSLVLTNRATRTLPVAVSLYITDTGTEWGKITAIATIIAIPAFIFTFSAARSLITGLTAGAVKG